jgi:lysophospholipase L1-like esterase
VIGLLLIWGAWIMDPLKLGRASVGWSYKPFLIFGIMGVLAILLRRTGRPFKGIWGRPLAQRFLLVLFPPALALGLLDLAFLFMDVPEPGPPMVIRGREDQSGVAQPTDAYFRYSPELIWEFVPGAPFFGKVINAQGFVGREFEPEKPKGMIRVICLGDSCTGMGPPTYADCLNERLAADPPTNHRWEAFNMGVHGYSSVQGLQLFRYKARALSPDWVTIYFGWNDHWLANGPSDAERLRKSGTVLEAAIHRTLQKKRSFRGLGMLLGRPPEMMRNSEPADVSEPDQTEELRVPPEQYQETLALLIREIRASGAKPVLITAPMGDLGRHLVHIKATTSAERAEELHDQYVDLTRDVASKNDVPLLDLAAMIDPLPFEDFFTEDGIHLTRQAREWVGDRLYELICSLNSYSPGQSTG